MRCIARTGPGAAEGRAAVGTGAARAGVKARAVGAARRPPPPWVLNTATA